MSNTPRDPGKLPLPPLPEEVTDTGSRAGEVTNPPSSFPSAEDMTRAAPSSVSVPVPGVTQVIGGYAVVKKIGEGGMGSVYLAEDPKLGRRVAIKTMRPELAADKANRDRFEREARAAAAVEHENIVPIWGIGESADGSPFIAMPFLQGEMLADRLRREPVSGAGRILKVAREVAEGLAAAHAKGLIHRDIKPGNIWLEGDLTSKELANQMRRCKILDFGLARSVEKEDVQLTASGAVLGTPAYMAPEQARGEKMDARTDLWSLGVVLYRMATGRMPFNGPTSMAVLLALATENPAPACSLNPNLPPAIGDLIHKLLSKDPAGRPQSANEVVAAAKQIIKELQNPKALALSGPVPPVQVAALPSAVHPSESRPRVLPEAAPMWEVVDKAEPAAPVPARRKVPPPEEPEPAAPKPKRAKAAPRKAAPRSKVPFYIAGAVLGVLALVVLAVVVLRVETPEGTLVVEINDPDVEARVKNGKLVLVGPDGKDRYTITASERNKKIAAGEYKVRVEGADGLVLDTDKFELKKNGEVKVRVTLDPKAVAKKPDPAQGAFKNSLGMEFVKVPKGTGWLGGGGGKGGETKAVIEQDFYLGKYEVTQEEWEKVTGTNPSHFSRTGPGKEAVKGITDADLKRLPVDGLSWDDCQEFIKKLNEKAKEPGWVYRLPTEVEWEYACRGGPVSKADSAFDYYLAKPTNTLLPEQANFESGGLKRPCQVGSYPPNVLGLHDMHGNIHEWCDDRLTDGGQPRRAARGATAISEVAHCRAAFRTLSPPSVQFILTGLRVARVPAPANADADRKAAEYVLSVGGTVRINGTDTNIKAAQDLPKEPFKLTWVEPGAKVTDSALPLFRDCKNLTWLNVTFTKITDTGLAHFKDHTNLTHVQLAQTPVTDDGLAYFAGNKAMAMFNLNGTTVSNAGLAVVKNFPTLQQLHLSGTPIGDAGLVHLRSLAGLYYLEVKRTKVTAQGVADLARALPQCRIEWDGGMIEPTKK